MNDPGAGRVLALCLDASDADLALRWAEEGALPALKGLLGRAARARTANPPALYVGAVWPSFVTSLSPARHGRYCYRQLVPGTYRDRVVTTADVRGAPFWRAPGAAGRRVAVLDVPKTALDRDVAGVHLVDWGTHDGEPEGFLAWPAAEAERARSVAGVDPVGPCDQMRRGPDDHRALRDALVERIARRERLVADLWDRGFDLVVAGFSESHCAGHQAWHVHDPAHERHDPAIRAAVGDPMRDVYAAIDGAVGRLVHRAGPSARVLVLHSHGMGPHHDGGAALDALLERLEAHLPAGRPPRLAARLARVVDRDRTRRWDRRMRRRLGFGLPLPSRRAARTCFSVPNNDAWAGIRVNVEGREPAGRIRPGAERDAYLGALAALLAETTDAATGAPAFAEIRRIEDLYDGPAIAGMPDLVAAWRRETPLDALAHPSVGRVDAPYRGLRTGDHRPDGLALALGPGIAPGAAPDAVRVEDLGPTICAWMDAPLDGVDGRPYPPFLPRRG